MNKSEVLKEIIRLSLYWESEGVVNISLIAGSMNSTPYYVRKRIKTLIEEGYIKKSIRSGGWCENSYEPYPPLKGYSVTEKTKQTELYISVKRNFEIELKKTFNCY